VLICFPSLNWDEVSLMASDNWFPIPPNFLCPNWSVPSVYKITAHAIYDVTPDDQRFVMLRRNDEDTSTEVVFVMNWFAELKARLQN
jgi:hypothetical protein